MWNAEPLLVHPCFPGEQAPPFYQAPPQRSAFVPGCFRKRSGLLFLAGKTAERRSAVVY